MPDPASVIIGDAGVPGSATSVRILLAPDKFRGTFTAAQVCDLLARGLRDADPSLEIRSLPLADGGEGTLDAILSAAGGSRIPVAARGALGAPVPDAVYGLTTGGIAVIESALICGLCMIPEGARDPLRASSVGLGDVVRAALDAGALDVMIGLGGTATVDGGLGMALALGYSFEEPAEGCLVSVIRADDAHAGIPAARFTSLCDVASPLLGAQGAAAVFGPQKGADHQDVMILEMRLSALAAAIQAWNGKDVRTLPRGGAAGGLGAGTAAFLGARLVGGADIVMDLLDFHGALESCEVVVTGEGSLDAQTAPGKVVPSVLGKAAHLARPTAVVVGRWDGSLPAARPEITKVFDHKGVTNASHMRSEDLVEAGRLIAAWSRNPESH